MFKYRNLQSLSEKKSNELRIKWDYSACIKREITPIETITFRVKWRTCNWYISGGLIGVSGHHENLEKSGYRVLPAT